MSGRAIPAEGRDVDARYEMLRGGALGLPIAPEARAGLAVLWHRGVAAWLAVVSHTSVQIEQAPSLSVVGRASAGGAPGDFSRMLAGLLLAQRQPAGA
jgi:hypothetical protein